MTRRYTDQTLTLLVRNQNLTTARKVYVTISQYIPEDTVSNSTDSLYGSSAYDRKELTIQSNSVTYSNPNTTVIVQISQEQNAMFKEGYVRVQINWIDSAGKRKATIVKKLRHNENLYEEVLS